MARRKAVVPEVGKFYRMEDLDAPAYQPARGRRRTKLYPCIAKVLKIEKGFPLSAECLLLDLRNGEAEVCKHLTFHLYYSELSAEEVAILIEYGISEIAVNMRGFLG